MSEQIDQTGFDIRAAQERVNEAFRTATERDAYSKRVRDNARIVPLLLRVGEIWAEYPDMRLGQLIMNAIHVEGYSLGTRLQMVEDDRLLDLIEKFSEMYPPSSLIPTVEETGSSPV